MLTACHRKLEARLDGLMRVLELLQTSPGDRLDAAAAAIQAALRHIDVAEPLHLQDEDESLFPRLQDIPSLPHDEIIQAWQRLRPVLVALQAELDAGNTPPKPLVDELARVLPPYASLQQRHHAQEEAAIWPVAAALEAGTWAQIAAEMKARRSSLESK